MNEPDKQPNTKSIEDMSTMELRKTFAELDNCACHAAAELGYVPEELVHARDQIQQELERRELAGPARQL